MDGDLQIPVEVEEQYPGRAPGVEPAAGPVQVPQQEVGEERGAQEEERVHREVGEDRLKCQARTPSYLVHVEAVSVLLVPAVKKNPSLQEIMAQDDPCHAQRSHTVEAVKSVGSFLGWRLENKLQIAHN